MAEYLSATVKPECIKAVNYQFSHLTGNPEAFIVRDADLIALDLAYVQVEPSQAHLREHLKTVADWNTMFPSEREGHLCCRLTAIGAKEVAAVKAVLSIMMDSPEYFENIEGFWKAYRRVFK